MNKRATVVAENLDRATRQVNALSERPAGLILNGDCVHVGGRDEYDLLCYFSRHSGVFRVSSHAMGRELPKCP